MKERLLNIAENRLLVVFLVCMGMTSIVVMAPRTAIAGIALDCEGSAQAYASHRPPIPCYCRGGRIVCDSPGSASGSSSQRGLSSKNQMKLNMLQGAMDGFANAFIRWMNAPSTPQQRCPTPEQIAEQQERAKAEWQAKVQKQINDMESQYAQMERQKAEVIRSKLLSGMRGVESGSPAGQSYALMQLRCSAFWSVEAARASSATDVEKFSRFAEKPDNVSMTECANKLPAPPMPSSGDEFRMDMYETIIHEVNLRIPMIEQAKTKQREADDRVAEKRQKVDDLKNRQGTAVSAEDKQATDDLMAEAMRELEVANALKSEADAGLGKLKLEIDALNEVGNMAVGAKQ